MIIDKEYPKGLYVIGDIHGEYDTLMALINKLDKDIPIAFVGDLVDRGPKSKEVIEFVKSNNHLCVMGNHEDMMISDLYSPNLFLSNWMDNRNGGKQTIESYTSPKDDEMLSDHYKFISNLPAFIEFPNLTIESDKKRHLVISHSSITRYYKNTDKFSMQIMRNRDILGGTLPSREPIFNIFGHTTFKEPVIKKYLACIDTGAVYGNKLTAIHFPSLETIYQEKL